VAVRQRHSQARPVQDCLLLRPNVGDRHAEPENPPLHRIEELSQPSLQCLALSILLQPYPVGELSDHDRARVAAVLLPLQPGDHTSVALPLRRLAQYVGIEQPAHNLGFLGYSRLRGGRSSIGTGHAFRTFSQLFPRLTRRNTIASSSLSKVASNA